MTALRAGKALMIVEDDVLVATILSLEPTDGIAPALEVAKASKSDHALAIIRLVQRLILW